MCITSNFCFSAKIENEMFLVFVLYLYSVFIKSYATTTTTTTIFKQRRSRVAVIILFLPLIIKFLWAHTNHEYIRAFHVCISIHKITAMVKVSAFSLTRTHDLSIKLCHLILPAPRTQILWENKKNFAFASHIHEIDCILCMNEEFTENHEIEKKEGKKRT